jgi:hypothetical protein
MDLQPDAAGIALGAVMALVTISMATGWHAGAGTWLLIAAGPLGMLEFGVSPVLQRIDLLGLAAFSLIAGLARWSADLETGRAREAQNAALARAAALRVSAGLALIVVAFAEKLANPEMAVAFLRDHPDFDVLALAGCHRRPGLRAHRQRRRGALRTAADLRRAPSSDRADRRRAVQRDALVPRHRRAARPPADLRSDARPLVYGSDSALRPAVSTSWPRRAAPHDT